MQLISATLFTTITLVGMAMAGTLYRPSGMSGLVRREIFRGECMLTDTDGDYPPPGKCSYSPPSDEGVVLEPNCDTAFPCGNAGDVCTFNDQDATGTATCDRSSSLSTPIVIQPRSKGAGYTKVMQLIDEERIRHRAGQHDRDHRRTLDSNKRDNPSNLWWHFRMMIRNISSRFIGTSNPMGVFEIDLHEAWDTFIEAAKVTPAEDAAADRLVAQVLLARELGQVSRPHLSPVKGKDGQSETVTVEHAIASSGERMWTDLPFFVTDLRAFWLSSNNTLEKVERTNLAAICGRLSASKICDPDVTCCALILLREALETPHALVDQEDPSVKPLHDYLPAVLAWLSNGTYQILALCMRDHVPDMGVSDGADWRTGGELMAASGGDTIGFSMLRWQFWSDRLRVLETDETGDSSMRDQAKRCANIMNRWAEITGGWGSLEERERSRRVHFLKGV